MYFYIKLYYSSKYFLFLPYLNFSIQDIFFINIGEATRLLAWLAKNSRSPSVLKNLVKADALPPVISMMKSEHVVMQKEALDAVNLVASWCLSKH